MNVSMQDGFNLGWKLGHVLEGRSPESLLSTYSEKRQVIAKNLIDFDKEWSTMMAKKPEEFENPSELEDFYVRTAEFPAGFMTEYAPSLIVADATHQNLATGFTVGKRFKSAPVQRVCDTNPVQLGHQATADGRWRIYVFADAAEAGAPSPTAHLAAWLAGDPDSPLAATPAGADTDAWFDVKVIYHQDIRVLTSARCLRCSNRKWSRSSSPTWRRSTARIRARTSSSFAAWIAASWWWCARTSTWPTSCR